MGKLWIVGTPIGNLEDFSPRAVNTLLAADFIAAEDTRVTLKLLNRFEIKKPLVSYHEHNIREKSRYIVDRILAGEDCAVVTDAGMPCISDPGEVLVRMCHECGAEVNVVPGPTALASAVALSGLPAGRFTFEGFLSVKKSGRREHLASLVRETRTMVFYEAPHKLMNTLEDFLEYFGDRKLTVCREITKKFEQTMACSVSQAVKYFRETPPKGEFVLVLEGCVPDPAAEAVTPEQAARAVLLEVKNGKKLTDAARDIARMTGCKKADIYKLAQEISDREED